MDFELSEELQALQETCRRIAQDKVKPRAREIDETEEYPQDLFEIFRDAGLLGLCIPEDLGGSGAGILGLTLAIEEVAKYSNTAALMLLLTRLPTGPVMIAGSEEQKQRYLPPMVAGDIIGCFGLTEPDFGSNPGGMITRAQKTDDGWVINGAKMWITNGSTANIAIIWAKTGDLDDSKSIRGFIVPTDTPGFSAKDQKGKLSLLASDTSELVLQDVRVPDTALLPKSGGLKSPLMCLTQARYGIAWGAIGAAMACYDEAVKYSTNRVMFNRPIGGTQIQQVRLAEMLTEITKAQLLAWRLGNLKEQGTMRPEQVSLAKRNNVDMACECAREARRLLGGNGILVEYQSMRHMANLESVYTYEGTHDVHALILGQDITGLAAY